MPLIHMPSHAWIFLLLFVLNSFKLMVSVLIYYILFVIFYYYLLDASSFLVIKRRFGEHRRVRNGEVEEGKQ